MGRRRKVQNTTKDPGGKTGHNASHYEIELRYAEACALLRTPKFQTPSGKPKYVDVIRHLNAIQPKDRSRQIFLNYDTLRNRFTRKHLSPHEAHASQQACKPLAEGVLIEWLWYFGRRGEPADKEYISYLASILAGRPVGKNWVDRFYERNIGRICSGKASNLDPKRAQAFNPHTVKSHFAEFGELIITKKVKPRNLYNWDEQGTQRGGGKKTGQRKYAVHPSMRGKLYKQASGNLELTTILEAIAADGGDLMPMFIDSGDGIDIDWATVHPDIVVASSDNGWTDDALGLKYLQECFIPQATARRESPDDTIVLVMDSHSHYSAEMAALAREHNIELYALPPHTTHKLQPLDVGVFGPFKSAWRKLCASYVARFDREMPRRKFVREYMAVRKRLFRPELIRRAFEETGLWPYNPDRFTDDDFGPSQLTSTTARVVPPSYPTSPPPESVISQVDTSHEADDTEDQDESEGRLTDEADPARDFFDDFEDEVDAIVDRQDEPEVHVSSRAQSPATPPPVQHMPHTPPALTPSSPSRSPLADKTSMSNVTTPSRTYARPTSPSPSPPRPPQSTPSRQAAEEHRCRSKACTCLTEVRALKRRVSNLEEDLAQCKRDAAVAKYHSKLCEAYGEKWKRKALDRGAEQHAKRRRLDLTGIRAITSDKAMARWKEIEAEKAKKRAAKEAKEREKHRKERQDRERRAMQEREQTAFGGRLDTKKLDELRDIAYSLCESIEGTKGEVLECIRARFNADPQLWTQPRYHHLFDPKLPLYEERSRLARQRARAAHVSQAEQENVDPVEQTSDAYVSPNEVAPPNLEGYYPAFGMDNINGMPSLQLDAGSEYSNSQLMSTSSGTAEGPPVFGASGSIEPFPFFPTYKPSMPDNAIYGLL